VSLLLDTSRLATNLCEAEEENADTIILKAILPPPPSEFKECVPFLPASEQGNDVKHEWEVDGDVSSHSTIDHIERITWRPAPSRLRPQLEERLGDQLSTSEHTTIFDKEDPTNFASSYETFYGVNIAVEFQFEILFLSFCYRNLPVPRSAKYIDILPSHAIILMSFNT